MGKKIVRKKMFVLTALARPSCQRQILKMRLHVCRMLILSLIWLNRNGNPCKHTMYKDERTNKNNNTMVWYCCLSCVNMGATMQCKEIFQLNLQVLDAQSTLLHFYFKQICVNVLQLKNINMSSLCKQPDNNVMIVIKDKIIFSGQ